MMYLLHGTQSFLINKKVKEITKENNFDNINTSIYDLNSNTLRDIIDDALTLSLFDNKKLLIVNNANIFTSKKNSIEHDSLILEEYINNQNEDAVIIFITDEEKLDDRKRIVKTIKKNGTIFTYNACDDINHLVKMMFDNYKIDNKNISLLISRVGKHLGILEQEVEKIKIYKDKDLEINETDILNLTTKTVEPDLFLLIDNIIKKDKGEALDIYHEMLINNEEPIKIIVSLANQFRIMYQSKELYKQGFTQNDIAKELEIHPYRVKLAIEKARFYDSKILLTYLDKLADLDYGIKSGTLNKEICLELFILNN